MGFVVDSMKNTVRHWYSKDLHRTGSSLCSGPAGSANQGKLKRVLLGYARWNPEVGYCQVTNLCQATQKCVFNLFL